VTPAFPAGGPREAFINLTHIPRGSCMSGHSKWATIKHKKAALDAKRGKIFTRLIKEIMIAARNGGDPDGNPRLRTAIAAAKAVSMPNDNIQRAIKRGTGEIEGGQIEEITFEGYAPGGAAIMVECATDNRNRTVSEIRHIFSKQGGNLGDVGSVAWMFERKSQLIIEKDKATEEQLMNLALEVGADDVREEEDNWEVLSAPEAHNAVVEGFAKAGIPTVSAGIVMIPKNLVEVEPKHAAGFMRLTDALEEHDDVQNVYTNADLSDEAMAASEK
jgi:YebC/PmpR family DNA-binding regulatory protein